VYRPDVSYTGNMNLVIVLEFSGIVDDFVNRVKYYFGEDIEDQVFYDDYIMFNGFDKLPEALKEEEYYGEGYVEGLTLYFVFNKKLPSKKIDHILCKTSTLGFTGEFLNDCGDLVSQCYTDGGYNDEGYYQMHRYVFVNSNKEYYNDASMMILKKEFLPPQNPIPTCIDLLKNQLDDIINREKHCWGGDGSSCKVRPGFGYDKFYLDWIDGGDMSLQELVHYIMLDAGIFSAFLSAEDLSYVKDITERVPISEIWKAHKGIQCLIDEINEKVIKFVGERLIDLEENEGIDLSELHLKEIFSKTPEQIRQEEENNKKYRSGYIEIQN
jgi:hypothetical protein